MAVGATGSGESRSEEPVDTARLEVATGRGSHPVARFLVSRVLAGLATLLVASFLIYLATTALPGDVASVVLGKDATPQKVDLLRHQLGLDQAFFPRYVEWLGGLLHGDLGQSAVQVAQGAPSAPVTGLIGDPLRNSAILALGTALLLVPLSVLLGVIAGVRAGRAVDHAISLPALAFNALPEFVLGTFLIVIFFSWLDVLPGVSILNPGESPLSNPEILILPVLTLLGVTSASCIRQIRVGVIEVGRQDYVTAARLNGLPERRVMSRYLLRNALATGIQVLAQNLQYLLGGIIVVESVFGYPGIGQFLVNAVSTRDVTEVAAVAMVLATFYVVVNILADLAVILLVPKLRTAS